MEYYEFLFEPIAAAQKDMLIALLDSIGFTGFEEENETLKAFINKNDLNEIDLANVIVMMTDIQYSRSEIQEINWNEKWEAGFEPVNILYPGTSETFVHLRAGFHKPGVDAKFDIVVTPKMSFGTGHHATTYLMIEQMSQVDFTHKKVIDFGTGTGILAILAEKLGAEAVLAIDNDDWSINNAKENISANHCERISLIKAETVPVEKSAIILANINLNIIVNSLPAIKNACEPGGIILFSGIMKRDEQSILKALKEKNIKIDAVLEKNGWLAIVAKRP